MTDEAYRLQQFTPAAGEWVSIHADPEMPDGSDPWTVTPVIGWAVLLRPDGQYEIAAVIGGETIEIDDDSLGVYLRSDLALPRVRQDITEICTMIRANFRSHNHRGCGAP